MKPIFYFFSLIALSVSCLLQAEVRQCYSIEEVLEEVDGETMVFFDIDNTLIEMAQTLGSDQWFNQQLQNRLKAGETVEQALEEVLPVWWKIVKVSDVRLVEEQTLDVFQQIQERALAVVGLTSRGRELMECTRKQLESVGIDFRRHSITPGHGRVVAYNSNDYQYGVVFCEGAKKGFVMRGFLQRYCDESKIRKIVFVDDTMRHLHNVEDSVESGDWKFVGFRYGVADEKVASFDPDLANIQLHAFEFIMSDDMAKALMEHRYEDAMKLFLEHFGLGELASAEEELGESA